MYLCVLYGGLLFWVSDRIWGRGLRGRTSLSVGAPLGNLARGSSTGALSSISGDPFTRNSERLVERGLWKRGMSLYGHSVKGTWRVLLYWGSWRLYKRRLWWWYLSIGAQLGNLEVGSFTRDFDRWIRRVSLSVGPRWAAWEGGFCYRELWEFTERGLWLWSISVYGSYVRWTWRGAHLLGALKFTKGRLWGRESLVMVAQMPVKPFTTAPGPLKVCDSPWLNLSICALIRVEDILSICCELWLDKQQCLNSY
jgi:hypothetical protein